MIETNCVYCDDCLNVLKYIPDNSIDVVITDPPYGIDFSRHRWKDALPSSETMGELFRVLKPNALFVAFSYKSILHRFICMLEDVGFHYRELLFWITSGKVVTGYYTDADRCWNTQLKNAYEPIVVMHKTSGLNLLESMQLYESGSFNIADNRIGDETLPATLRNRHVNYLELRFSNEIVLPERVGRYPTNVVFDEEAKAGLPNHVHNYFYSFITSPKEKHLGCEHLADDWVKQENGLYHHKIYKQVIVRKPIANFHPTVKPLALMRWLCRLVTRKNGLVLDPFAGSGTTLLAAMLEGVNFIGVEKQPEYIPIIEGRLNAIEKYRCL